MDTLQEVYFICFKIVYIIMYLDLCSGSIYPKKNVFILKIVIFILFEFDVLRLWLYLFDPELHFHSILICLLYIASTVVNEYNLAVTVSYYCT